MSIIPDLQQEKDNKIMFQKTYLKTYQLVFFDKCLDNGSTYTY